MSAVLLLASGCSVCGSQVLCKGLCSRHYARSRKESVNAKWRERYASDPEFRARHLRSNKLTAIRNDFSASQRSWREANPIRCKATQARYRSRVKAVRGVYECAKWYRGRSVEVFANGSWRLATIAAPAFQRGSWFVAVKLPWGEVVEFETKAILVGARHQSGQAGGR